MAIPRLDILIKQARSVSTNDDHDDDYGLSDAVFIEAANQANFEIQKYLYSEGCEAFTAYEEYDIVANQEAYDEPRRIFVSGAVYEVWYSADGSARNYYPLKKGFSRGTADPGEPETYFLDNGQIFLDYIPQSTSGKLRIRFEEALNRLDIRRGQIASRVITATEITEIVLEEDSRDDEALEAAEFVCVVDRYGTMLMRNVPIDSYDASVFTITTDFEFEAGETAPVGAYVTAKGDCSTHSALPDFMESFFVEFMKIRAYETESSIDLESAESPFVRMLQQCVEVYSMSVGKTPIPEMRDDRN